MFITLPELPKEARTLLVTMSNMSGSGFKHIKSLQVRLLDVTAAEVAAR